MRHWGILAICAGAMASAAIAAPLTEGEARKVLFPVRGVDPVLVADSGLDATQTAIIEAILKQMLAETVANYYGAVAVSPSFFGLMTQDPGAAALSGLLQISEKFHSAEAAAKVALAACDAARGAGQAHCVVAARVLPRKWTAQPLQLSVAATDAFKAYRKGKGPKALAISAATTAFAIGRGDAAATLALTDCNAAAAAFGQPDCRIVVQD